MGWFRYYFLTRLNKEEMAQNRRRYKNAIYIILALAVLSGVMTLVSNVREKKAAARAEAERLAQEAELKEQLEGVFMDWFGSFGIDSVSVTSFEVVSTMQVKEGNILTNPEIANIDRENYELDRWLKLSEQPQQARESELSLQKFRLAQAAKDKNRDRQKEIREIKDNIIILQKMQDETVPETVTQEIMQLINENKQRRSELVIPGTESKVLVGFSDGTKAYVGIIVNEEATAVFSFEPHKANDMDSIPAAS